MEGNESLKEKSGIYIKRLRTLTDLKQKDFALKLNVTRSYISQLETNQTDISLSRFLIYCDIFEINYSDVLEDKFK